MNTTESSLNRSRLRANRRSSIRSLTVRGAKGVAPAAVPFLPAPQSRTRQGDPRRPAQGSRSARRRGRSSPALDVAPPCPLGSRALRPEVLSRDDPRGPAPPQAVVEEGQEAAR